MKGSQVGVGRTTSIYNLDLHDGPFDAHGLSFIRPISPEHIYAKCCFRPLECLVKQCTVPAVLELIFCLKRWSKPINEKPHNTHHTEIRIQKIKDCKGLEQGFSSLALLTFGYLILCWTDSWFCSVHGEMMSRIPGLCQLDARIIPLIAPTKNAFTSCWCPLGNRISLTENL